MAEGFSSLNPIAKVMTHGEESSAVHERLCNMFVQYFCNLISLDANSAKNLVFIFIHSLKILSVIISFQAATLRKMLLIMLELLCKSKVFLIFSTDGTSIGCSEISFFSFQS
jgi:hypothetical protein